MFDFLFEITGGYNEGAQFFVECDTLTEAWEIADENFPTEPLKCWGKYSIEEGEMMGLDTLVGIQLFDVARAPAARRFYVFYTI